MKVAVSKQREIRERICGRKVLAADPRVLEELVAESMFFEVKLWCIWE